MKVILYSTGCPKCRVLKTKLDKKNINYIENNDVEEMLELGFDLLPVLKVDNDIMNFTEAIKWIGEQNEY